MSRISPATLLIVIFALLFGAVAAFVVRRQLQVQPVPPRAAEPAPITVPLASMNLDPGKPLTLPDIALLPLRPADMKARNLPAEMMANPQQIIGRILREPMIKGEAFVPDKFYPEGTGPSISERLKPGSRAVTVLIKGAGALAGFAVPGSIVDVVFRTGAPRKDMPQETMTLVQGAEILALADNSVIGKLGGIKPNQEYNPITLAVSAEDANRLKVVEGQGDLSLTLRGASDANSQTKIPSQTLEMLLGIRSRPGPWMADVYRRGARQTLAFEHNQVVDERFGGVPNTTPAPVPTEKIEIKTDQPATNPANTTTPGMPWPWGPYYPGMIPGTTAPYMPYYPVY